MSKESVRASRPVWALNENTKELQVAPERNPRVKVIAGDTLVAAAKELATLPDAPNLKVKSGEHLAGIVLGAYGSTINVLDTDGGFDFELSDDADRLFDGKRYAIVEVKSAGGDWREFHSKGGPEDVHSVQIERYQDALIKLEEAVLKAETQLNSKHAVGHRSREVFLTIHPLDLATDIGLSANPRVALHAGLPAVNQTLEIEGLWLMFYPGLIARWSQRHRCWVRYLVAASSEHSTSDSGFAEAESAYLKELAEKHGNEPGFAWSDGLVYSRD
ncbi:hypothetical protein AAFP32_09480 [Brevibacterium sp. CBA3109]|uniref:DUF91 domain-containing protein n=1 Tax=Brevibacterium koreense TaxID=3140787 RepID=A0AAU7UH68_9MICO